MGDCGAPYLRNPPLQGSDNAPLRQLRAPRERGDPQAVIEDSKHSKTEPRSNALGKTAQNRLLHITFTLRQDGTLIRVISARDMHRKEKKAYEQA
jgi:uncharacterized DUF497 family protein